ncbi:2-dehydro-3-deoxygalactonokinase [Thalassotalea litorea]|uniref:2-dehydro-3-deoxygalactonokinase n=1 Tax=Thalassotalea litorea TaxID=2020715 RepID=A0A5R9IIA9_9GAMM|nr:2-dehydro-3-deoxygalactonokinase [Thalassotalea litorea]TLU64319.1 2-dehydro-3-deoxygalactonokinase [Thalassotalea litorea]
MDTANINHVIVDWGTTNFRAFAMDAEHRLLATKEASLGLLSVSDGNFAQALQKQLGDWLDPENPFPVFMAGMVGSAKGWVNVPYAQTPACASDLVKNAYRFELPWGGEAIIIPGVSHNSQNDQYDVMRGEEVQLLGLAELIRKDDFQAVLPGTHSKQVAFEQGMINHFSSYLTGEVFSVFSEHTMLGKGLPKSETFDQVAFIKGVKEAQSGELTNKMFLAWTHRLFNNLKEQQIKDYLSGLLIGFELRNLSVQDVFLVGGQALCQRYELALQQLSKNGQIFSGNDCFLAGMKKLISELQNEHYSK